VATAFHRNKMFGESEGGESEGGGNETKRNETKQNKTKHKRVNFVGGQDEEKGSF
jgi:hypothetical protein